jgi:hypothetical protein
MEKKEAIQERIASFFLGIRQTRPIPVSGV